MSSNPSSAAIHILNDDVLLRIIEFNGNMFTDSIALYTTCITSHVCRQWRDLMLKTPSLWAKLIDVERMSDFWTLEWRKKLIRRTGRAPLWIRIQSYYADNMGLHQSFDHDKFWYEFILENWNRIQRLAISQHYEFAFIPSILRIPAPQLEYFEARYKWDAKDSGNNAAIAPLFANHAPMLRDIYLSHDFIDLRAPWLPHLHSMTLDDTYTLSDAIVILSATHNLQALKILDISIEDMDASFPIVSLLHLQDLQFGSNKLNAGIALLEYIEIPVGYSLSIHIDSYSDGQILEDEKPLILSTIDKFIHHASRSFRIYTFNHIALGYKKKDHIFLVCRANLPDVRSVRIWLPLRGDSEQGLLETFLTKLLPLDMTGTKNLWFIAQGRLDSHFWSFFSRLDSVDTLSTDLETLSKLADVKKSSIGKVTESLNILFPMLKNITLLVHLGYLYKIPFVNQVSGGFLQSRLQAGRPITMFDMSKYPPLNAPPNLQAAGDVKGLTVRYRLSGVEGVVEYIYGARTEKRVNVI